MYNSVQHRVLIIDVLSLNLDSSFPLLLGVFDTIDDITGFARTAQARRLIVCHAAGW